MHTWAASRKESGIARTVVLKPANSRFSLAATPQVLHLLLARSKLTNILSLLQRVGLRPHQRLRLVGVGLSSFCDPEDGHAQSALFS